MTFRTLFCEHTDISLSLGQDAAVMMTILLLITSNVFMTVAWYGHFKFKTAPLMLVIYVSWLIALPEYILQVPANRLGYGRFTATQLKILQEVISLCVFVIFGILYLQEYPTWRTGAAIVLVVLAVWLALSDRNGTTGTSQDEKITTEANES